MSFILVIFLIITERLNRAVAALSGAIVCYFVLIFLENYDFSIIVDLLFSSKDEDYVNLHALVLIIGMMIIVQISHEAGMFQFIAINMIKLSKAKPVILMIIMCVVTLLISAILNNILTVIILIPLTITISRILNINPSPYILTQAILVNIGGTIFSISSIPNILITTYADICFLEFFLTVGLISIIIFFFTLAFFILLYKSELTISEDGLRVLKEYNVWNVVQNKRLLYQTMTFLVILFALFLLVPSSLISPDIIALTMAIILIIISRLNPREIISKIDIELIFYLLGIFIMAGALEITGLLNYIGDFVSLLGGSDTYILFLLVLWLSALLSSSIDNIPITKVLIPIVSEIPSIVSDSVRKQLYIGLDIGANWGDNLTPLGDNILVVNIAEQNKRPISINQFFKLGFITTIYQLFIVSIIYTLIFRPEIGLIVFLLTVSLIVVIFLMTKVGPKKLKEGTLITLKKMKLKIIK
jgi:Na+/H+ antiporter NhaD/arsenite permease-like protein